MSRNRKGRYIDGIVLLDKPAGITSNKALQRVRQAYAARKAGHTGNLDPFATGMLPICLGEATKTAAFMIDADKAYRAVARLGLAKDTGDIEGLTVSESPVPDLAREQVLEVFESFTGEIEQVPPMYSALKHQGRPLYELARQGKSVERKPRKQRIHRLELLRADEDELEFEVQCSKGTYIRTLAEDFARAMGTCAHLVSLRRLWVAPFDAAGMITLQQLESDAESGGAGKHILPVDAGLSSWPVVSLQAGQERGFRNGNPQRLARFESGPARVYGPEGQLLGLGECTRGGVLKPRRIFLMDGPRDL